MHPNSEKQEKQDKQEKQNNISQSPIKYVGESATLTWISIPFVKPLRHLQDHSYTPSTAQPLHLGEVQHVKWN